MNHTYVILCHKWTPQLARMVSRFRGAGVSFLVHVDARQPPSVYDAIVEGLREFPELGFVPRHKLYWGGMGILEGSLEGIRELRRRGQDFDFISILTSQCYPIKPPAHIEQFLSERKKQTFMTHIRIPTPGLLPKENNGLDRFQYWHLRKPRRSRLYYGDHILFPQKGCYGRPPFSWIWDACVSCVPIKRKFIKGFDPWYGGCYWTMSSKAAHYLMDFLESQPSFLRYFKYVLLPDEHVCQTVLMNSPLRDTVVNDDFRHIDWNPRPTGGPPAFMDGSDFETLRNSPKLIARKFDEGRDPEIMDRIDRELLGVG